MSSSSTWDGTLSAPEFIAASDAFLQKWKTTCHDLPPWSWLLPSTSSFDQVGGYLALQMMPLFKPLQIDQRGFEVHYYDFHIVYSASYKVPVMYFRGYRTDGQQLVLDEIEKDLPSSSSKLLMESKWTFITQMEHPYLNRPWFTLHPCGTNELMRLLLQGDPSPAKPQVSVEEYLVSWLSVVGQVVGINVPLQLAKKL